MVTEQEENSLGYLLDPAFQLVNSNGKPLTDGWIECYIHGTRNKYYCYSDWNGNLHPFRVPIDSIGSNVVLADPNRAYDVYVYNKYGTLIMSRYNVSPGHASGASVGGSGDAGHWIARLGSTTTAPKNQYSNSIPIPANPDYEGNFVDRINGNNIYLKEGVYLVDAILRFRQNPDDLSNTFGDIHVFTGVDDAETVVYNRNETGPDADETDYHQIRVQFVRHVTGNTDDVVCFQVKSTNALSWIQIQNLSIVKLGGSGIAPQPVEYSAGQYISIENDEISVTGLQPSGNYANAEAVAEGFYGVAQQINTLSGAIDDVAGSIPSIEGLASEQYVDEHIEEAVSGKADRSEIPSLDGYATQEYVQSQVSGKADKSEIPSLDGYATETYVQSAVSGKQDELEFTYDSDNKITSIDGHGIAGTGGGGGGSSYIPGQYISIQNDVISVTGLQPSGDYQPAGDYLTHDDLNGYATDDDVQAAVSGKADVSAIPSVAGLASEQYVDEHITEATSGKADVSAIPSLAGYATESWVDEQGFLKEVPQEYVTDSELNSAISGKADKSEIPSIQGLASETYVDEHIQSATSGKADKSEIPSLAGYATQDWVNQQGFVDDDALEEATSGKQDSLEFCYTSGGSVSAINNSGIYDAQLNDFVNQNSAAWGGSGLPISAGPGINIRMVDGILVAENDETLLYSGSEPTSAASLSETWKNFDRLKIYVQNMSMDNCLNIVEVRPLEREGYTSYYNIVAGFSYGLGTNGMIWENIIGSATDTVLTNHSAFGFQNSWTATAPTVRKNNSNDLNCILKVIGINRIAGGN